jgi:hypothetical protein
VFGSLRFLGLAQHSGKPRNCQGCGVTKESAGAMPTALRGHGGHETAYRELVSAAVLNLSGSRSPRPRPRVPSAAAAPATVASTPDLVPGRYVHPRPLTRMGTPEPPTAAPPPAPLRTAPHLPAPPSQVARAAATGGAAPGLGRPRIAEGAGCPNASPPPDSPERRAGRCVRRSAGRPGGGRRPGWGIALKRLW